MKYTYLLLITFLTVTACKKEEDKNHCWECVKLSLIIGGNNEPFDISKQPEICKKNSLEILEYKEANSVATLYPNAKDGDTVTFISSCDIK